LAGAAVNANRVGCTPAAARVPQTKSETAAPMAIMAAKRTAERRLRRRQKVRKGVILRLSLKPYQTSA
jgi:hypothetical protein